MPSATSLVARSYPDKIIGVDNALPWHLGTDLKHFRLRSQGHAIIMGRKTYESIGRPLPKRLNIILSRNEIELSDNVKWAPNPETALLFADQYSILNLKKEFFVIGGENIYNIIFKYINKIFLTEVFCGKINGDAKFDYDFDIKEWWYHSEREFPNSNRDDYPFRITCLIRRKPVHRFQTKEWFMNRHVDIQFDWDRYVEQVASSPSDIEQVENQMHLFSDL